MSKKQRRRKKKREQLVKSVSFADAAAPTLKLTTPKPEPLVRIPDDIRTAVPSMDVRGTLRAIADGENEHVWSALIDYLLFFEKHNYKSFGCDSIRNINGFVHCLFTAMVVESCIPTASQVPKLVQMNHLIHHIVASSSYRTTDPILDTVLGLQYNVPKIMALLNPRCEIQLDQEKLFELDPTLASIWYMSYLLGISSPTPLIQKNMYRHLELMSEKFVTPYPNVSGLYFGVTYHNPGAARRVKGIVNKAIKAKGNFPVFNNNPDPKSIGIVTCRAHRNHAVWKSAGPLITQLCDKYRLTLIWTGPPDSMPATTVREPFDKIVHCHFVAGGGLHIPDELLNNDFQMLYYPDIGMSDESIWMSNMRIAPIQAVGYGHPDTTGDDNEIDYFIGGDIEKDAADAYSETMVLIPGLAQEPAWPSAKRQNNYIDDGVVRINCVWGPDKWNASILNMLAEINRAVARSNPQSNHEFHFFGSPGLNRYAALPSFIREVTTLIPNAQVHSEWEYFDYMREAEKHDFSLNSFPFGCYNVLVESLFMGLPFLTLVGERFYNRAGMYLNNRIGMGENNFESPRGLIEKAATLITEPDVLRQQRDYLASVDLKNWLFTLQEKDFLKAVDHIITNHPFDNTVMI